MRKLGLSAAIWMSIMSQGCASYGKNFEGWFSKDTRTEYQKYGQTTAADVSSKFKERNRKIALEVFEAAKNRPKTRPIEVIIIDSE